MRLFLTLRSPFARKVQLQLMRRKLAFDTEIVDLANRSPAFVAVSPVGKVPVLVDGDEIVFDSTILCEYLDDRYGAPAESWRAKLHRRTLDELGDSLSEQAIAHYMGRAAGADTSKAERVSRAVLDALEARAPAPGAPFGDTWGWGDDSVLSALGYTGFRLGDGWRDGRPRLAAWFDAANATPEAQATLPRL